MEREGNPSEAATVWQVLKQPRGGAIHNELMFLADASEQLTGSLDPHTILERLARLSVPFLAERVEAHGIRWPRAPGR